MRAAHLTVPAVRAGPGVPAGAPASRGCWPAAVPERIGALVLVAHGSRDPCAAPATEALLRAVGAVRPELTVRVSYLDHGPPSPGAVLHALQAAGERRATVVPLLLTAAYHRRVDIPQVIAAARDTGLRLPVRVTDVLGPVRGVVDGRLLAALRRRLVDAGASTVGPGAVDAVVLAAAGTRDAAARRTVEAVAAGLGRSLGLPCLPAYASAAQPTVEAAMARLAAAGARQIAVAAYFLAPGRLYAVVETAARAAGAVAVAAPMGAAPELARLILARAAG